MIDLKGKTVFITGGSRGIGRATALLCAKAGADIGISYHTRKPEAEQVVREVRALGRRAYAGGGDLGDPEQVDRIFREFRAVFEGLDHLVANAGVWPEEDVRLGDLPGERWRGTMKTNLDSVYYCVRAAAPIMRPGGSMVLVSSTAAQRGEAGHADYAASKGAIVSMVKSLAVEYAPHLRVNSVAPGWVDTDMSAGALAGPRAATILNSIPMSRAATAEEIAGPIAFLCSELAAQVTGEILNVNGGSVLCG